MLANLELIAPIFALMLIGFVAVRSGYFPAAGLRGVSAFIARVAVPVLIFKALAERDLAEILNTPYLLAYSLASLIPFGAAFVFARLARGQDTVSAAFYGMGASFSNSIMIGLPIITALFGQAAMVPFALTLLVENLLMMPLTLALADSGQRQHASMLARLLATVPTIARNPIVIAIVLGLLASVLGLPLPAVATGAMGLLASTVTGAALFAVGGMLVGQRVGSMALDLGAIAAGKLLLHPLATFAVFALVPGIPAQHAAVAVLLASAPMFGIYAVLGEQYGKGAFCAAAIVPTTALSFLSITAAVSLLLGT